MESLFYPLVVIIQYVPGYNFSDSVPSWHNRERDLKTTFLFRVLSDDVLSIDLLYPKVGMSNEHPLQSSLYLHSFPPLSRSWSHFIQSLSVEVSLSPSARREGCQRLILACWYLGYSASETLCWSKSQQRVYQSKVWRWRVWKVWKNVENSTLWVKDGTHVPYYMLFFRVCVVGRR